MKKTINSKILRLTSILLFSCFLGGLVGVDVLAADNQSIVVHSNVYNATTEIDTEFKYKIEPSSGNPTGATKEPTELTIKFDNVVPNGNQATLTSAIDFSETIYTKLGTYKYTVEEVSSSNPDYPVSSEKYEIYVVESNTGREVYQQAKNLKDDTKGEINFNHQSVNSYIAVNLTVHGDEVDKREFFKFRVYVDSYCTGCQYDMLGQDEYVNFDGQTIKTSDKYITNSTLGRTHLVQYATHRPTEHDKAAKYATYDNQKRKAVQQNNMMLVANTNLENNIYLKDGQGMTIGLAPNGEFQIPIGTKVKIIADDSLDDRKWTMYVDGVETKELAHVVGQEIDFDILIERNMLVPYTGVFYESLPFVLLVLIGVGGAIAFVKLKAKNAK